MWHKQKVLTLLAIWLCWMRHRMHRQLHAVVWRWWWTDTNLHPRELTLKDGVRKCLIIIILNKDRILGLDNRVHYTHGIKVNLWITQRIVYKNGRYLMCAYKIRVPNKLCMGCVKLLTQLWLVHLNMISNNGIIYREINWECYHIK